jgi:hypothetical protein
MLPTSTSSMHAATILKVIRPRIPRNLFHRLRHHLPQPRFLLFHWTYFITICMVSSIIFWQFSTPHGNVSYVDSLFMVIAAMTQAGLNTINPSSINTFQQCILFGHIIIGNPIFISAFVVHVRKRAFHPRFKKAAEEKERSEKTTQRDPITWQSSFLTSTEPAVHPRQTLHCASSTSTIPKSTLTNYSQTVRTATAFELTQDFHLKVLKFTPETGIGRHNQPLIMKTHFVDQMNRTIQNASADLLQLEIFNTSKDVALSTGTHSSTAFHSKRGSAFVASNIKL